MDLENITELVKTELKSLEFEEVLDIYNEFKTAYIGSKDNKRNTNKTHAKLFYNAYLETIEENNKELEKYILKDIKSEGLENISVKKYKGFEIVLKNFIKFATKYYKRDVSNNVIQRTSNIALLKYLLEFLDPDSKKIFVEFEQLEKALNNSSINSRKKSKIIMSIIAINAKRFSSGDIEQIYPDKNAIINHKFKSISDEKVELLVDYNLIDCYIKEKGASNRKNKKELINFIQKNPYDFTCLKSDCLMIMGIIEKQEKTDKDYDKIMELLENLGISDAAGIVFKIKCQKKEEPIVINPKPIIEKSKPRKLIISQKEINTIYREVNTYFDFEQMQSIRVLTLNEIIYVLGLLKYIHADDKTIERFLLLSEKESRKEDVMKVLEEYYNKIIYYSDNEHVKLYLDEINKILNDPIISSTESEEYKEVESKIHSYMKEIFKAIDNDFSFEKACAKGIKRKIS